MEKLTHKLYLIVLFLMISVKSKADIFIAIENKGSWHNGSTWDKGRLPCHGDTIIIPYGIEVNINEDIDFEKNINYCKANQLRISGSITFNDGKKLNLPENSSIILDRKATINLNKHRNQNSSYISIHLSRIWATLKENIQGPKNIGLESSEAVLISNFEINSQKDKILISWTTEQLSEIGFYELSVSNNGKNWESIKRFKATLNDNDNSDQNFMNIYKSSEKELFFKLESFDLNGKKTILVVNKFLKSHPDFSSTFVMIPKALFISSIIVLFRSISE